MNVCKLRNVLNVETGKPHLKNHTKKWVGLVGKSCRVFLLLFPFMLFFDSYIVFDSCFLCFYRNSCREMIWKKGVMNIFKINRRQFGVQGESFRRFIFGKVAGFHCVKSVQIWGFSWSIFSCIWTGYRKIKTRKKLHIWILFVQCSSWQLYDKLRYLAGGFQGLCLDFKNFFQSSSLSPRL